MIGTVASLSSIAGAETQYSPPLSFYTLHLGWTCGRLKE